MASPGVVMGGGDAGHSRTCHGSVIFLLNRFLCTASSVQDKSGSISPSETTLCTNASGVITQKYELAGREHIAGVDERQGPRIAKETHPSPPRHLPSTSQSTESTVRASHSSHFSVGTSEISSSPTKVHPAAPPRQRRDSKCQHLSPDNPCAGRMKAVLPGKPESQLQALATGCWDSRRVTVSVTRPAISEPVC